MSNLIGLIIEIRFNDNLEKFKYQYQKGIAPVILVIILLAVAGVGGGVYYKNKVAKEEKIKKEAMEKEKIAKIAKEEIERKQKMTTDETKIQPSTPVLLKTQNNSGIEGLAKFSEMEGKLKIDIQLTGVPSDTPRPAHIHVGSCPNPGAVKYPLTNVVNGKSETILSVLASQLVKELPLAVNVHKSSKEAQVYVACGDITEKNVAYELMMEKKDDSMMMKFSGQILAGKSSPLLDFSKADFDKALASDKLVVLYFYANWCPICKAEFPKLQQVFNELTIDQIIGFRVNYNDNQTDSDEKALASQYGVAYQHTKVFIKNGQRIGKWPDSWNKDRYLSEINSRL